MKDTLAVNTSTARIVGLTKAALRLIGGADLADAIGDLTGLGRVKIDALVRRAESELVDEQAAEFRYVSLADREWAEGVLLRTYQKLASHPEHLLIRESLIGPQAIAPLVMDSMVQDDRADVERASDDSRAYFTGLSHTMAHIVSAWYVSDPAANRVAISMVVGHILETLRGVLAQVDKIDGQLAEPKSTPKDRGLWQELRFAAIRELSRPPEYYPSTFENGRLGDALSVVELDESQFHSFEGRGLYWNDRLPGVPAIFGSEDVAPGDVVVMLGNPGSGKTTKARALVLAHLNAGRCGLYCRLEDLVDLASAHATELPVAIVLMGFARSARVTLDWASAIELAREWREAGATPLIVLDGLDELASAPQYADARRIASDLGARGHPVVITSRISGYARVWDSATKHVSIAPLSEEAQDSFVLSWFDATGDSVAVERYETAKSKGSLTDALESPLTLGFVCLLAHFGEVPLSRGKLFDRFVDHFIRAPWKEPAAQQFDVSKVGELRNAAELIAWTMAIQPSDDTTVWGDTASLSDLARTTASAAGYSVFAGGLLIPHGPVEPLGATQQTVRWLHRAIHENLVAQHIRWMIIHNRPGWRRCLLDAILTPTWWGAKDQLISLVGESDELHEAIDELTRVLHERGDTPSAAIAQELGGMVGDYCTCRERKAHTARTIAKRGNWGDAYRADPLVALPLLNAALTEGEGVFDSSLVQTLYNSHDPAAWDTIERAAGLLGATHDVRIAAARIELDRNPSQLPSRYLAVAREFPDSTWFLDRLHDVHVAFVTEWVGKKLRCRDESERVLLSDAWTILRGTLGERNGFWCSHPDRLIRLTAQLGSKIGDMDHDLAPLYGLLQGDLVDEDAVFVSAHLEIQGFDVGRFHPDVLGLGRAHLLECCAPDHPAVVAATTLSRLLAIEILKKYSGRHPQSFDDLESLLWAMHVLLRNPSADACAPLWLIRERLEEGRSIAHRHVDYGFLVRVLNSQPWHELAARILLRPTDDPSWDGVVLCAAATISGWERAEFATLGSDLIVEYFEEGIARLLRPGVSVSLLRDFELPDHVTTTALRRLARRTIELGKALESPAQQHVHRRVEQAVQRAGLLREFVDALSG